MSRVHRAEEYLLRLLEKFGKETSQIVLEMSILGWPMSKAKVSRLRTGSEINIDVAGLPFFAIRHLYPPVARIAQTTIWMIRLALKAGLSESELQDILENVAEEIRDAEYWYKQLKEPIDDEAKCSRAIDRASIEEAKGHLEQTRGNKVGALRAFLKAYRELLPFARGSRVPPLAVFVSCGRALAAALTMAYDLDDANKRSVGKQPIGEDWYLWHVIECYKDPSALPILSKGIERTTDDRVAANHVDGFGLANRPSAAARMIQIGLTHAGEGVTLESWQPFGRTEPVICEQYLTDAVSEYNRLFGKDSARVPTDVAKVNRMNVFVAGCLAALTALAIAAYAMQAEARPGPITSVQVAVSVG